MTTTEFSNEFDILYNNIMSNAAPGLNEYEKSVFLTKAQYEIVKSYFSPKGNKFNEGFDDSSKRQIDFSKLTVYSEFGKVSGIGDHFNYNSTRFKFPKDAMMILNETLRISRIIGDDPSPKTVYLTVVPINYEEYSRLMSKPFKYPTKNQAWRLLTTTINENGGTHVEIISGPNDIMTDSKYFVRYLKRPNPIVLDNLPEGLSIDGEPNKSPCELDEELHHEILQRAVELAKAAYTGDLSSQIALGQQSETNMGSIVQSR